MMLLRVTVKKEKLGVGFPFFDSISGSLEADPRWGFLCKRLSEGVLSGESYKRGKEAA